MNVNYYVRTKEEGLIGELIEQNEQYVIVSYKNNELFVNKDSIKSSPNIIDLIEVGDYVNGMEVKRICFDEDGEKILNLSNCILELMNEDIKSIVTKEQFESMKYEVK